MGEVSSAPQATDQPIKTFTVSNSCVTEDELPTIYTDVKKANLSNCNFEMENYVNWVANGPNYQDKFVLCEEQGLQVDLIAELNTKGNKYVGAHVEKLYRYTFRTICTISDAPIEQKTEAVAEAQNTQTTPIKN